MNVLLVFAHPDDETVLAGTTALLTAAGADVTLVCTSNGAAGGSHEVYGPEQLARIRQEELREACAILGIARLECFEDRHPPGEPHLDNPDVYEGVVALHERWVLDLINQTLPDIVATFGPDGITGHRAHGLVGGLATRAARAAACKPAIYHAVLPLAEAAAAAKRAGGYGAVDRQTFEQGQAVGPNLIGVSDDVPLVVVDITATLAIKQAAVSCHITQGGPDRIKHVLGVVPTEWFERV